MAGIAGYGGNRRSRAAGGSDAAADLEPACPAAGSIPPITHGAAVGRDIEHIQMLGKARYYIDRRSIARGQGGQRADPVPDYLTANMAKRYAEIAHLAIVLRPIAAAVIVMGAFEQSYGTCRHGAGAAVHGCAVRVRHGRYCGGRRDCPVPFQRGAIVVGGNVGFSRFARRVMIVTGFAAAGPVGIFIGQAESGVSHLMNGDLGCAPGK